MLAPFRGLDPRLKQGVEVVEGPPNTKKLPFKVSLRPNEAVQRVTEWARS